ADPGAAVVVGALPLGPLLLRPARAGCRTQAHRAHLVEADDRAVRRRLFAQLEDPSGFLLIVGVGAGLPGSGALKRQSRFGQQRAEMPRRDDDPLRIEM